MWKNGTTGDRMSDGGIVTDGRNTTSKVNHLYRIEDSVCPFVPMSVRMSLIDTDLSLF